MDNGHPGRVQDYTTAALILIGVNLMWIMGVIWVLWGAIPVVLLGLLLWHLIDRLEVVVARRRVAARKRHGPNMPSAPPELR